MINEIRHDLHLIDQSPRALRKFGWLTGVFLFLVGGLLIFKHRHDPVVLTPAIMVMWIAGLVFVLAGQFYPRCLRIMNTVFSFLGLIIAWVITRLTLIIMFYLVFFPFGTIMRLTGKDSLNRKLDRRIESYWIQRPDEPFDPARCRRLF
ncbi:hypothetical protein JXA80_11785 [bacterium]|nr:hypothetical protein [candidate division CSSED10-310 bacterium]